MTHRSVGRTLATAIAAVGLVIASGLATGATLPVQAAEVKVSDAVFEWGVNEESGSRAFAPGTCNFLSAGVAGNTGSSRPWTEADGFFKGQDGNVQVLRPVKGGTPQQSTFANKCQTSSGDPVGSGDAASHNYVQFSQGTGTVDPDTDTGTIEWKGSFTIVYYSGYTYWSISDPKLEVTNGHGKMTGTFSGYGTSMDDMSTWVKLKPTEGTIADFTNAKVDLTDTGFTVTPDFAGVNNGQKNQNTTKDGWGSFPTDWVDYNTQTGQSSYWYTSGGSADAGKATSPITVSWGGGAAPVPSDRPTSPAPQGPTQTPTQPTRSPQPTQPTRSPQPTPSRVPEDDKGTTTSATLYWPVNQETSAGGFAPGTCNFMSAGVSPNNGGSKVWDQPGDLYKPVAGNVRIEKPDQDGTFHTATWENKCDDRNGNRVVANDPASNHESRVVIEKGSVDTSDGITAKFTGGFTIVFYSGMTYWSISDPQLTVNADGTGELTGTASGYGAAMEDLNKWDMLQPEEITMATFEGVDVKKAVADGGFTVTPDFDGVEAPVDNQDKTSPGWGSFPESWVTFNQKTGQSSYWYTSGGISDPRKKASPLTISLGDTFAPPADSYNGPTGEAGAPGGTTLPGSAVPGSGASKPEASKPGVPTVNSAGPANGAGQRFGNTPDPAAQSDDNTAFAPVAAQARAVDGVTSMDWRGWALGGGIAGGAVVATCSIGALLRRKIGLDPYTWD